MELELALAAEDCEMLNRGFDSALSSFPDLLGVDLLGVGSLGVSGVAGALLGDGPSS